MLAINMWALAAVLLLTAQHCQTHDVQNVQGNNDNLLVHVISSMVKYAEKINDMEHKLSRQQENHDDELEKIANDINKVKTDHSDDIKKLQKNHDEELEKITNDINKIKDDHSDDIEKIRNDHADDIEKMQKKHTEDIEMLKPSLSSKQPVVGFHVARTKAWSTPGKVPFDKVFSNYGNGWNSITHIFTVPTKGLYFLTLTVMNSGGSAAYSWLMRGSTRVALAYADGGHSYNVGTVATVQMLIAGEHIYAQHEAGTLYSGSLSHYTYLAGFLIQKTN